MQLVRQLNCTSTTAFDIEQIWEYMFCGSRFLLIPLLLLLKQLIWSLFCVLDQKDFYVSCMYIYYLMMCTTFFFCQVAEKIRFWRVEVQLVFSRLWGKDFYGLVEPCIPLNIIYMILLCKFLCQLTLLCAFRMWLQPLLIISSGLNGLSGKKLLSNSPSASWYPAPLWICFSFS